VFTHTSRSYGAETDEIPTDSRLTSSSGVPWYALLRDGKYKYIRNLVEGETEEIYDLEADPEELTNLAAKPEHAELLKSLRAKAIAELRKTDAKFVDRMPKTRAELGSAERGARNGERQKAEKVRTIKSSALRAPSSALRPLDIYWIDVEGGAATLIVTPAGESVLIDSGNPGVRDATRIFQVATREAGLKKIDHLITTHYHRDHFGGAAQLSTSLPIGEVHDNGEFEGQREKADPEYYGFKADKRSVVSPGDEIPLKPAGDGVIPLSLRCLGARQKFVGTKGETNECCTANVEKPVDNSDNANSVVMLLKFGDFDFLDTGDLTWNREFDLVCPANRVGKVDVFQASHHGLDVSNNPVLIKSVEPRVAIVNNGVTKGNQPVMFATLQETKSIEQVYQVHKTHREDGTSHNVPDEFIANHDKECKGEHLKLTVAADGKSYTVTVPATGHTKTYACK
jgi:beta-lactamase superfamily II metal-dependent hydrolase